MGTYFKMKMKPIYCLLFFISCLNAQSFGQNKVQYRDFEWNFIQSPHFDIYYYGDRQDLAEFTAEVAEVTIIFPSCLSFIFGVKT